VEFFSTRDASLRVTAAKAISQGLSFEGGLFAPVEIPKLDDTEIDTLCGMSYPERAAYVIGKYLTDFTSEELLKFANAAYHQDKFSSASIAPVRKLNDTASILELWHGPTSAFKDMALQILPHLLTASMRKCGETKTACILVATSGDTGKAALEGFADVEGTKIAVFYPKDGVSRVQELQMTTQSGNNVYVSSVIGNFDHVQSKMKEIFADEELRAKVSTNDVFFSSANSINWGRAVPQIAYYVSGYCELVNSGEIQKGEQFNVCVPTGNFGNILAAYYAREMGIPIAKLICASNKNNVLSDFFKTGKYDKKREFFTTTSPAMDILVSSNLERLLFHLSDNDDATIKKYMAKLTSDGAYTVNADILSKLNDLFYGGFCDDADTMKTISQIYSEYNYLVDTHTAVGINVYNQYIAETGDNKKTLIASTASPFKFADSVLSALGVDIEIDGCELLEILSKTTGVKIPAPLASLAGKEERFVNTLEREQIIDKILDFVM